MVDKADALLEMVVICTPWATEPRIWGARQEFSDDTHQYCPGSRVESSVLEGTFEQFACAGVQSKWVAVH